MFEWSSESGDIHGTAAATAAFGNAWFELINCNTDVGIGAVRLHVRAIAY
jgi:hypothetical protein